MPLDHRMAYEELRDPDVRRAIRMPKTIRETRTEYPADTETEEESDE